MFNKENYVRAVHLVCPFSEVCMDLTTVLRLQFVCFEKIQKYIKNEQIAKVEKSLDTNISKDLSN